MSHNKNHTAIFFGSFLPSPATITAIDNPAGRQGNSGDARAVLETVGKSDEDPARLLAELFETLLVIAISAAREFLLK